jgi:hypothetical protein
LGNAVLDQCDIDGEVGALADEFLGAVERIDKEEARGQGGAAVAYRFLGDDGHRGKSAV